MANSTSALKRRLRAISGDQNDETQKITAEKLKNMAKSNSFAMIGAADIPDEESDTEIKKEEEKTELEISKIDFKD